MSHTSRSSQEQAIYERLVYANSDVLCNKFGITQQDALDKLEARFIAANEASRPIFKEFTLAEMQAVHQYLLNDLYEWAGQLRTYTTGRGSAPFARPDYIASYFDSAVHKPLQREAFLRGASSEQFAQRSAHFVNEINATHPFIDGNGRITRLWLQDLAEQAGFSLSIANIAAQQGAWYEAMRQGFEHGKIELLKEKILRALL